MSDLTPQHIALGLTTYVVLLFSLSFHESAHAWMAWKLGDDTAKNLGRVSLNPIVHIDPIGTLLFPLIQIFTSVPLLGWAKPTPYNPANFRRDVSMRKGHILVAAAGPVSNFILALIFTGILIVIFRLRLVQSEDDFLFHLVTRGIELNVLLAVFNLIPIPPLDGSKVASFGLPGDLGERYDRIVGPYGFMILMLLLISGAFGYVVYPVERLIIGLLYGLVG
ncbi:MAG TPA: site-2 protease family protein [Vicinamibacteria bacterium]|nr:site-2 protease family protein [Vicinamibacteria bacterium]